MLSLKQSRASIGSRAAICLPGLWLSRCRRSAGLRLERQSAFRWLGLSIAHLKDGPGRGVSWWALRPGPWVLGPWGSSSSSELTQLGAPFCSFPNIGSSVPDGNGVAAMKDMQAQLEKLRTDAAECALIRDLATDPKKRELFTRLADHLTVLASEVERAIADSMKRT